MKRRGCVVVAVVGLAIAIVAFIGVSWFLNQEKFSRQAEIKIQEVTGLDVEVGPLSLGLIHGLGLKVSGIVVREPRRPHPIIEADAVGLNISLLSLLQGKLRVREGWIRGLRLHVVWEDQGTTNIHRIVSEVKKKIIQNRTTQPTAPTAKKSSRLADALILDEVWITRGQVDVFQRDDTELTQEKFLGRITDIALFAEGTPQRAKGRVKGTIRDHNEESAGNFFLSVHGVRDTQDILASEVKARIRLHSINLQRAYSLYPGKQIESLAGVVDGRVDVTTAQRNGTARIEVEVKNPQIAAPIFKHILKPGDVSIRADAGLQGNIVSLKSMRLSFRPAQTDDHILREITSTGTLALDESNPSKIGIGVVTAEIGIHGVNAGAIFRAIRFTRPSPITQLEANVDMDVGVSGSLETLSSKGRVTVTDVVFEQPKITYGAVSHKKLTVAYTATHNMRTNELVVTNLSVNTMDFALQGSGRIRHVTRSDRYITATIRGDNIPLVAARKFMLISNKAKALKKLLFRHVEAGRLQNFKARISGGKEEFKAIRTTNSWDAVQLEADVEGLRVNFKPAELRNGRGHMQLKGPGFALTKLTGLLDSAALERSVIKVEPTFKGGPAPPTLTIDVESSVDVADILGLLQSEFFKAGKVWDKFDWRGPGRLEINLAAPLVKGAQFMLNGRLNLDDAYLDFGAGFSPFWHVKGPVVFKDRVLYAPQASVYMGPKEPTAYPVTLEVTMDDLLRPEFEINMQADEFPVEYLWREGAKTWGNTTRSASSSTVLAPAAPSDIPVGIVGASDDILDTDADKDLPKPPEAKTETLLTGRMRIKRGSFRGCPFEDLDTSLTLIGSTIYFHALRFRTADGLISDTSGTGWVSMEPLPDGRVGQYHLWPEIKNADIEQLQRNLGIDPRIKGRLTLTGEVHGTGQTMQDIARDLSGALALRLEKGDIMRTTGVSEVLKRSTMKLGAEGMTYNDVKAAVTAEHGVLTITRAAMRGLLVDVTGSGTVDVPKETVDLEIIILPIGLVPAGIPILDIPRKGLAPHITVKGKWDDPKYERRLGPRRGKKRSPKEKAQPTTPEPESNDRAPAPVPP